MRDKFTKNVNTLIVSDALAQLQYSRRGIEKESLRVCSKSGKLASTPHPEPLGSALTNPYITTDYSEALLELITPVHDSVSDALNFLEDIHRYVYHNIDDEILWVNSMPCILQNQEKIPLARYGNSNIGRMKTIYRRGLGYRYGRLMQTIAGVHFNYSFADSFWQNFLQLDNNETANRRKISNAYFSLLRNFHRHAWLVLYLFGASPAICKSFLQGQSHNLFPVEDHSLYAPYATSIRMSDLGYTNKVQSQIKISYDDLDSFVHDLQLVIETPYPDYEKIGVIVDGKYRQLNYNLLQIENEYYSLIRPKRVAHSGEKPTVALSRRGVEYVEVRCLDLNPFYPTGINENQIRFLEAFLLFCLLEDSPGLGTEELTQIRQNHDKVVLQGRNPQLQLVHQGISMPIADAAHQILSKISQSADLLDRAGSRRDYSLAVNRQADIITDTGKTPSAKILSSMQDQEIPFFRFAMQAASDTRDYFGQQESYHSTGVDFKDVARKSLATQRKIEAEDTLSFDDYLEKYFQQKVD